jgi:hypothetical protein
MHSTWQRWPAGLKLTISLIVLDKEGAESGRTLESEREFSIRVAMTADRERFEALFLDVVNGRLP